MNFFEIKSLEDISILRESSEVECKLANGKNGKGALPNDMWESYSAFANTDGGAIVSDHFRPSFPCGATP